MDQQEALLRWLRIAWEKGVQTERLAEDISYGQANTTMDLQEAARQLALPLSPHLGRLGVISRMR